MILKIIIFIGFLIQVICGFMIIRRYKKDKDYKTFKLGLIVLIINIIYLIVLFLTPFIVSIIFPIVPR
jgi:hypothetical protein